MSFNDPLTQRLAAFLQEIGLEVEPAVCHDETFLPGIQVCEGRLLVDEAKLLYPGDLLHEAGHLAVLPRAQRSQAVGEIKTPGPSEPESESDADLLEAAAIAWSYAAALRLELDPAVVFHPHGYRGNSAGLLLGFRFGVFPGSATLAAVGMTLLGEQARAQGLPAYPQMQKWLRD